MKTLLTLTVALLLVACGNEKTYVPKVNGNGPSFGSDPAENDLKINAQKEYFVVDKSHQNRNTNGIYILPEGTDFIEIKIPASINVISGNSGNYYTIIDFDGIVCFYKGDAAFSYPAQGSDLVNIGKGEQYNFSLCQDSESSTMNLDAGDKLIVERGIEVEILDGDSTATTVVQAIIEVLD